MLTAQEVKEILWSGFAPFRCDTESHFQDQDLRFSVSSTDGVHSYISPLLKTSLLFNPSELRNLILRVREIARNNSRQDLDPWELPEKFKSGRIQAGTRPG